jgi:hypothetical protein
VSIKMRQAILGIFVFPGKIILIIISYHPVGCEISTETTQIHRYQSTYSYFAPIKPLTQLSTFMIQSEYY